MPSNASEPIAEIFRLQSEALRLRDAGEAGAALEAAQRALDVARDVPRASGLAPELLLLVGNAKADLGRFAEADDALSAAASDFLSADRLVEYAQAMIGRGRILAESGRVAEASRFFQELENMDLPPLLESQVLNNLGVLYRRRGDPEKGAEYLRRDLEICRRTGDERGAGLAHFNLAITLKESGDAVSARRHAAQAAKLLRQCGMGDLAARAERVLT